MIVAAAALVAVGAALFGVALATSAVGPLYGSIAVSIAALASLAVAVWRHHRRAQPGPLDRPTD